MSKKNLIITIKPGCISCGCCQAICPEVFQVKDVAHVVKNGDLSAYASSLSQAASMCPVGVIHLTTATQIDDAE
jgi:ferredoxin